MVRLGILSSISLRIFHSPRFETDYQLLGEARIEEMHEQVVKNLTRLPYGPFEVLQKFVGPQRALQMCPSQCISPPGFEDNLQGATDQEGIGKGEKRRLDDNKSSPRKSKTAKLTESLQEILDEADMDWDNA
jgi:hypothetical protein